MFVDAKKSNNNILNNNNELYCTMTYYVNGDYTILIHHAQHVATNVASWLIRIINKSDFLICYSYIYLLNSFKSHTYKYQYQLNFTLRGSQRKINNHIKVTLYYYR